MRFFSFSFPLHFLCFLFIFTFFSSSTHSSYDDRQSLLAFKNDITSDPHASMAGWSPSVPFCNWTAVTCSRRHRDRVVSLDLSSMDLGGTISSSLANLSFLRTLDLGGNVLHGYIPRPLGRLFRLRKLWLHQNQLKGNIPSDLSNCTNMVSLALSYNNLTGNIPQELGSLRHLQQLFLGANSLTEYGLGVAVSTQGDVYSYGIMLLEMLTRKQPTSDMFVGGLNLHNWVNFSFPSKVKEVIDNTLFSEVECDQFEENNIYNCMLSLLHVGLLCSKHSPEERPTMRVVVRMLESIKEDLVANGVASMGLRRSISNLLNNTNATRNNGSAINDQSSSTF